MRLLPSKMVILWCSSPFVGHIKHSDVAIKFAVLHYRWRNWHFGDMKSLSFTFWLWFSIRQNWKEKVLLSFLSLYRLSFQSNTHHQTKQHNFGISQTKQAGTHLPNLFHHILPEKEKKTHNFLPRDFQELYINLIYCFSEKIVFVQARNSEDTSVAMSVSEKWAKYLSFIFHIHIPHPS